MTTREQILTMKSDASADMNAYSQANDERNRLVALGRYKCADAMLEWLDDQGGEEISN